MAQVKTPHYEIYKYWKDKFLHSDGSVSTECLNASDIDIISDSYVPCCWGCGRPVVRDSRLDAWLDKLCTHDNEEDNLKQIWNDSKTKSVLNRCHIIPGALGGKDEPSNLFLMCEECHQLSPDTVYPFVFFEWVIKRHKQMYWGKLHPNYALQEVDKELRDEYNISLIDLVKKIGETGEKIEEGELNKFMCERIGTHGPKVVESSWIAAIKRWLLSKYINAVLKN